MLRVILCAVADDEHVQEVVATGRRLAATGAFVPRFVHVAHPVVPPTVSQGYAPGTAGLAMSFPPDRLEELTDEARTRAEELLASAGAAPEERIVAVGEPVDELCRLAEEHDAALLCVGTRAHGPIAGALLGSVARSLVQHATRPVVIARRGWEPSPGGPILCGVETEDGESHAAAATAASLASVLHRPLVLAHAMPDDTESLRLGSAGIERAERRLHALARELEPAEAQVVVRAGDPPAALEQLAAERDAALIVVGTHRSGALASALHGSVSLDLANTGGRPVVIVPAPRG